MLNVEDTLVTTGIMEGIIMVTGTDLQADSQVQTYHTSQ